MNSQLVIVGNPTCRRVASWRTAAEQLHWPVPTVVPYADLLTGRMQLASHLSPGSLLRWESAAENWETFKLLLKEGIVPGLQEGYPILEEPEIDRLAYERGWLVKPRQCYLGFARLMRLFACQVRAKGAQALNQADDIPVLFDKPLCQDRLARAGIPIPLSIGAVDSFEPVRAFSRSMKRVMVKLAHGSGAAGCLALHWSRGRLRALTTLVEVVVGGQRRWYCSKKPQFLLDEAEIAALVNRLCVEKVQVEEWLPKARWKGQNFDLRIVTIGGRPRHVVARASPWTFTNLTLGGHRGDLAVIQERIGTEGWQLLRDTCAMAARVFPGCYSLGIDLLLKPDYRRHVVLEINAFGELLLNQLDEGENTYTAILSSWKRNEAMARPTTVAS